MVMPVIYGDIRKNMSDADRQTYENVVEVIHGAGIRPISVLGFLLNLLVVWVFRDDTKYSGITCLFQILAVFDNFFIVFVNIAFYVNKPFIKAIYTTNRSISVHVAMLISIYRWINVSRSVYPGNVKVTTAVILLIAWCLIFQALVYNQVTSVDSDEKRHSLNFLLDLLALCIPVFIQVAFSLHLLWIVRKTVKASISSVQAGPSQKHIHAVRQLYGKGFAVSQNKIGADRISSDVPPPADEFIRRQRSEYPLSLHPLDCSDRTRWITYMVVSMCVLPLLAYPVVILVDFCFKMSTKLSESRNLLIEGLIEISGTLLQVTNSSVNFIFYFFFLLRFRTQLASSLGFRKLIQAARAMISSSQGDRKGQRNEQKQHEKNEIKGHVLK